MYTPTDPRHIVIPGVNDAGQVTPFLYRGSQPTSFDGLLNLGIKTIVDLRGEDKDTQEWESYSCSIVGIKWVSIPIPSRFGLFDVAPTIAQAAQFGSLINPALPLFVHCKYGHDRTGAMCAWYRIVVQGWTFADAYQEMLDFHFASFWHPAIKKWVKSLNG